MNIFYENFSGFFIFTNSQVKIDFDHLFKNRTGDIFTNWEYFVRCMKRLFGQKIEDQCSSYLAEWGFFDKDQPVQKFASIGNKMFTSC